MKNLPKLQGVEVKSESGQEEEFDEIDIKEHRLIDIQIAGFRQVLFNWKTTL